MTLKKPEIKLDTTARPKFSRFQHNLAAGASLPIFRLAKYDPEKGAGVVMVGDYIAQDLVSFATARDPLFPDKWIIISTTQSDAVPTDCVDVDFNFFTNYSGKETYLSSPAASVPFSTELGDGHYVDPDIFYPRPEIDKIWDILYPAKWYPTKNTELLLDAAELEPSLKIAIYGWPVVSERKRDLSLEYRDRIVERAKHLNNVYVYDNGFDDQNIDHQNPDGSIVIGRLSKTEMRDHFYCRTKSVVFLSETTEAINRACTEALCCDVPILVSPTNGGLDRLVNPCTGVFIERSAEGIINGYHALRQAQELAPRWKFTRQYGKQNANIRLRKVISDIEAIRQTTINWNDMTLYGGDLWVPYKVYSQILTT